MALQPRSRIVLVRHGPSAEGLRGWFTHQGITEWHEAYDLAGIQSDSRPSESLVRLANECAVIVASDLPRAVESSQRLANGRPVTCSALLREIPLPIPRVRGRFPIVVWGTMIHLHWVYAIARRHDLPATQRERVRDAAEWLITQAGESTVLAVTHGVMRRALAQHLVVLGWHRQGSHSSYRPWSAWTFDSA